MANNNKTAADTTHPKEKLLDSSAWATLAADAYRSAGSFLVHFLDTAAIVLLCSRSAISPMMIPNE